MALPLSRDSLSAFVAANRVFWNGTTIHLSNEARCSRCAGCLRKKVGTPFPTKKKKATKGWECLTLAQFADVTPWDYCLHCLANYVPANILQSRQTKIQERKQAERNRRQQEKQKNEECARQNRALRQQNEDLQLTIAELQQQIAASALEREALRAQLAEEIRERLNLHARFDREQEEKQNVIEQLEREQEGKQRALEQRDKESEEKQRALEQLDKEREEKQNILQFVQEVNTVTSKLLTPMKDPSPRPPIPFPILKDKGLFGSHSPDRSPRAPSMEARLSHSSERTETEAETETETEAETGKETETEAVSGF